MISHGQIDLNKFRPEYGIFIDMENKQITRDILSIDTGNTGRIRFKLYLDEAMSDKYNGVMTLRFDNGEELHFLYRFENSDVSLIYVPENAIEDGTVYTDQYFNPVRIFFRNLSPGKKSSETDEQTSN